MVGIDISSTAVKLIELEHGPQGYGLTGFGMEFLPADAMDKQDIKDPIAVGETIKHVLERSRSHAKHAIVAMSGSSAITKVIQMSAELSEHELETQIMVEADQYIPYPREDISLDFVVLGTNTEDEKYVDVLLAACHREKIESRVDALEIAGLSANVVDLEAYAMERAYKLVDPEESDDFTTAVIDVGANTTNLSVLKNNKMVYTREQDFGGKELIDNIQAQYNMSFEEAMIAKRENSLPHDYEPMILAPFRQSLAQRIARSLQFFYSSSHFNEVKKIIIAGGSATVYGLCDAIQKETKTPTVAANPFEKMWVSPKVNQKALSQDAPAFMLSCGLAMRAFQDG